MSNTIFKRFFEVRVLHGYYLDHWYNDINGKPELFQDFSNAQQNYVLESKYNILNDLIIEPTEETRNLLNGLKMRWRATPLGLMVGIEVTRTGVGAAAKFFPKRMPPANSAWTFTLRSRNLHLHNITNHAMRPTLAGRYYFSNLRAVEDTKTFPSLATRPSVFTSQRTWEMGELAIVGGALNTAKKTTANQADFIPVSDKQWAHTGDRAAFPKRFNYRFDPSLVATAAEFILLTAETGGTIVKTISKDFSQYPGPVETALDFQFLPLPANPTDEDKLKPKPLPDGWYFLKIKVNGADFEGKRVLLRSDLQATDSALFGVVEISMAQTKADFKLLNIDNSLRLTPIAGSNPVRWAPPIFEIRLLGRQTYWRYEIDHKENLPSTDITTYTEVVYKGAAQHVVSKAPRRISLAPTYLPIELPAGTGNLPAPDKPDLKYDQDQYFSELFLSTIKLT